MIQVISLGVAAWMVYEAIRAVALIPAWLQPLLVAACCYGLMHAPAELLTTLHASALVAVIRLVIGRIESAEPLLSRINIKSMLPQRVRAKSQSRLPDLP